MYVVLVYDISLDDNGRKRWSHVFKICKKYLTHIQNSVFEGEISKVQAKLKHRRWSKWTIKSYHIHDENANTI